MDTPLSPSVKVSNTCVQRSTPCSWLAHSHNTVNSYYREVDIKGNGDEGLVVELGEEQVDPGGEEASWERLLGELTMTVSRRSMGELTQVVAGEVSLAISFGSVPGKS
ncbi:unnamed protein product [Prunus armeniaca]